MSTTVNSATGAAPAPAASPNGPWRRLARIFVSGPDQPVVATPAEVDRTFRRKRLAVMLSITIGYGIAYTCRLGLSVVKKPLIDGGIFNADQLGIIGSALFYSYAFGKLVNGFLADHANMKLFGPVGAVVLSQWFSNRERGRYYSIWSTAHSVGEGLTLAGLSLVVAYLGWRGAFIVPGIVCSVLAGVLFITLQDRPRALGLPSVADWKNDHGVAVTAAGSKGNWRVQLSILKLPSIWVLAGA